MLSDEQMSNGWSFSLLNDEQMSNKVRVEHQPVNHIGSLGSFLGVQVFFCGEKGSLVRIYKDLPLELFFLLRGGWHPKVPKVTEST